MTSSRRKCLVKANLDKRELLEFAERSNCAHGMILKAGNRCWHSFNILEGLQFSIFDVVAVLRENERLEPAIECAYEMIRAFEGTNNCQPPVLLTTTT